MHAAHMSRLKEVKKQRKCHSFTVSNEHGFGTLLELLCCERELCLEAVGSHAVVLHQLAQGFVLMVALVLAGVVLPVLVSDLRNEAEAK